MKLIHCILKLAFAILLSAPWMAGGAEKDVFKVVFSPQIEGADREGLGVFVRDVVEVALTDQEHILLIERSRLADTLSEAVRSEVQSPGVESQLKVVGAQYAIFPKMSAYGKSVLFTFRVVDLSTSEFRSVMVKAAGDSDPMVIAKRATKEIVSSLETLSHSKLQHADGKVRSKWSLPEDTPRPKVAIRIPESSTVQRNPDPAGEKELSSLLLANKFPIIQLSRPSQSTNIGNAVHLEGKEHEELLNECRQKGVGVMILGIAASDRATQIGSYHVGSARIELTAVRVSDSVVLASAKGYGKATDLSSFVAEKKAIENAVRRVAPQFIGDMVAKK